MQANVNILSDTDKQGIVDLINDHIQTLGSLDAVAKKVGVSIATISLIKDGKYQAQGDTMYRTIAAKLGYREGGWQTAETTNIKTGISILNDAQQQSLFLRIADKAGSGKTTLINAFIAQNKTANVFRIICRDWGKRELLIQLCQSLGIASNGHKTQDNLLQLIIDFFTTRKGKPLLIIDQANSLKPSSLLFLIHLFNECEDKLGVVIVGTENIRQLFERGVKYNRSGYDELDSRFGRTYIPLIGNTKGDTKRICNANGIDSQEVIDTIWKGCQPIQKTIINNGESQNITVIEDGRKLKRSIIKHLLISQPQNN